MKRTVICLGALMAVTFVGAVLPSSAQTPLYTSPPPPMVNSGGMPEIKETEVLPDGRIIIRIRAPEAHDLKVSIGTVLADLHSYPMTKDKEGVWSATSVKAAPEIYPYRIEMGRTILRSGAVQVPGARPALYDVQNVPHGSYNLQNYFSKVRDGTRMLGVYLPAAYFTEPNRRFPVLYWYDDPQANIFGMRYRETMDNLIAQKKAVPMIVVFMIEDAIDTKTSEAGRVRNSKEFATDIMPLVDKLYRTIPDRDHRAMAGISHNGAATWTTGLRSLDKLAHMGVLSTGMFGGVLPRTTGPNPFASYLPWEPDKILPDVTKAMRDPAHPLKLLYFSEGDIDPRVGPAGKAVEQMKKYGLTPIFEVYPGGHQTKAFRPAFISFVSRLFK